MKLVTFLRRAASAGHLVVLHPQSTLNGPDAVANGRVRLRGQGDLRIFDAFGRRPLGASVGNRGCGVVGEGVGVKASAGAYHLEGTECRQSQNLKVRVV